MQENNNPTICEKCFWGKYDCLGLYNCRACAEWYFKYDYQNGDKRLKVSLHIDARTWNQGSCAYFKPHTPLLTIIQHKWQYLVAKVLSRQETVAFDCDKVGIGNSLLHYTLVQYNRWDCLVFDVRLDYGVWPVFSKILPVLVNYFEQHNFASLVGYHFSKKHDFDITKATVTGIGHRQFRVMIPLCG